MKYEAEIDGARTVIDLEERDGLVHASVDQKNYEIKLVQPEDGVYVLFLGTSVYEARVWTIEQNSFNVKLGTHVFSARFIDRKHRRTVTDQAQPGQQYLIAPMPGKVVRVLLSRGTEVKAGEGVVVVEAMKMQNEVKSPKSGRLVDVRVKENDTVTANQILAIVE
jgi:biotin carboxyl carrier protein